ncbi:MAG: fatty-acid oxidation protein subunit alpha [Pleurocapsa sp. SU_196_0]|nr:fatty-acid oxidation protein subunit alpha [Pleurocapsa sp. SU_196_0]
MARDLFHNAVRYALEKEGWAITADPLKLTVGSDTDFLIDLAAERLIVAQRGIEQIAVEVKGFTEPSKTHEFHAVLGQYINYRVALHALELDHVLLLAVPEDVFETFFQRKFVQMVLRQYDVKVLVYDPTTEEIIHDPI